MLVDDVMLRVHVEEADDEGGPLERDDGAHHVERDRGQTVLLQKSHQEAEADEDHHVHILKHCGEEEEEQTMIKFVYAQIGHITIRVRITYAHVLEHPGGIIAKINRIK